VGPTPLRVALRGPCGQYHLVNGQGGATALTWPWWSLEGSHGH
jgi:hypothetical protein